MATPLRALVVEDSEDDTLLLLRELRRAGFEVTHQRVETHAAMSAALEERTWDVVISDFSMPHFGSPAALRLLQEKGLDLPFIIVSGTVGEETAVAAMKTGAHDYILKGNLTRFVPVVQRELREAEVRRQRRRAEEDVRRQTQRLNVFHEIDRAILSAESAEAIAQAALHHIRHLVPCLTASVVLFDFAAQEAVLLAAHPKSGGMIGPGTRLTLEEFGAVAALREGRVDSVEDMQRLSRLLPLDQALQAEGTRSYIRVPLTAQGELIGALTLGADAAGGFTPEHLDIAREVADQLAIAIQQARLHEQIQRHAMELEQRVAERTAELRTANQQLQEASRHKSQFLTNMSHELRTPLNSILGFADLLLGQGVGPLGEKQARYLTHIHNSGKHLLKLISDILDLSKVEAGKFVLQPEALTVGTTLEDILVIGRGLAHKKSQTVTADIQAALPPLRVDAVRFKQILFNLLSNAVKFTPESGLITVTARKVDQSTGQVVDSSRPVDQLTTRPIDTAGEWLEIAVTDTGVGIKAEEMALLFQEFTQIERTHAQRQEGTGLGLALTRRLVELHGGRIWGESEGEDRGSTFTVVLPFAGPET